METLRWLFVIAISVWTAVVLTLAQWEGQLRVANTTYIIRIERAPAWEPPEAPALEEFRRTFGDSKDNREMFRQLCARRPSEVNISRVLKWDWMLTDWLLGLWVISSGFGGIYFVTRGGRRDAALHFSLSLGICMTLGVLGCLGLWLLIGGWGPPVPILFGALSMVLGILTAAFSYERPDS